MYWKEALSSYLSCAHIHQRARWRRLSPSSPWPRNPSKSINSPKVPKARQLCSLHDSWTPKVHRCQEELKSPLAPKLLRNNDDTLSKKTKQKQLLNSATLLPRPFLNWSRQVSPLSSWNFSYFPSTWSALPPPCLQPLARWNALSLPHTHSMKDPIHSESWEHWEVTKSRLLLDAWECVPSRTQILRICLLEGKGGEKEEGRDKNAPPFSLSPGRAPGLWERS